jgi:hypothetical protein
MTWRDRIAATIMGLLPYGSAYPQIEDRRGELKDGDPLKAYSDAVVENAPASFDQRFPAIGDPASPLARDAGIDDLKR